MKTSTTYVGMVLLFTSLFLTYSCQKEEDDSPTDENSTQTEPSQPSLNLEKGAYKQLEMGQIETANLSLNSEEYQANLDTISIQLSVIDNDLYFITPDISPGNYQLNANIEGSLFTLDLTIDATANVASPTSYVNQIKDQTFNLPRIDSLIDDISDYDSLTDYQAHKNALSNLKAEFELRFSQYSNQEKAALAKFMKANEAVFNYQGDRVKSDSLNTKAGVGRYKVYMDNLNRVMLKQALAIATTAAIGVQQLTACAASAGFLLPACALSLASGGTAILLTLDLKSDYLNSLDKTLLLLQSDVAEMNEKSFQLKNDQPYELDIRSERRSIYKPDLNSNQPQVSGFIRIGDKGVTYWNKVSDFLNDLTRSFNKDFDVFDRFPHPQDRNGYSSQWIDENADFYTIANVSNDKVKLSKQQVINQKLVATFTNTDTAEQQFSFDLIYDDGDFRKAERISATIEGMEFTFNPIHGFWELQEYNTGDSTYSTGDWRVESNSEILSGPCNGTKIYDTRSTIIYETFDFMDSTVAYTFADAEQQRTWSQDSTGCTISYDAWGPSSADSDNESFNYELISSSTLVLSDSLNTFSDTLSVSISGNNMTVYSGGWVSYFSKQ